MNSERVKPLKTKKLTSSTPAHKVAKRLRGKNINEKLVEAIFEAPEALSDSYEILPPVELETIPRTMKPTYLNSVCEAIQIIGVPRKGASYISIKKWIRGNRGETIPDKTFTAHLKRAIESGLESGVLSRSKASQKLVGLRGSFVLAKAESQMKEKPKVAPANKESKSSVHKTQKAKGSSAKGGSVSNTGVRIPLVKRVPKSLNLSDTTIVEAKSTKLMSAVGKKVTKPKVDAKLATKKTNLGKVVPVSKAMERLNGIKKPKLVISKAPKAKPVEKTVNSEVQAKATKARKLYASYEKPTPKNFFRKDLSDTELEVKPAGRKSMKSYSSDTDISMIGLKKNPNPIKPKPKMKLKMTNSKAV